MADKKKTEEKPKEEVVEKKEGAEGEAEVAKPKSKKKLIIIILAVLLLIGGAVGGLFAAGIIGGGEAPKSEDSEEESEEHAEEDSGEHGDEAEAEGEEGKEGDPAKKAKKKPVFLDLPDIIVNLNSPTPRPHFINLKLTLEISTKKNAKEVEEQLPRIIDSFNAYLREIRKEDLQGSAGMYRLENELMLRMEKLFGKDKVTDILFREIIVQ